MQIHSLRLKSYRSFRINEREVSCVARIRLKKLEQYWTMRDTGCSQRTALTVIEVSRATFYRWQSAYQQYGLLGLNPHSQTPKVKRQPSWSKHLEQRVLHLRRKYPLWGKKTLTTVLNREAEVRVSESMVGRILSKLVKLGKVKPVRFYYGQVKAKKRRTFNHHAKRWLKGMKSQHPGELLQIDHMTVSLGSSLTVKHFEATCPVTKVTIARAYSNASSQTAAKFLSYVLKHLPFKVQSIQVDGGSEFMKDFESSCQLMAIGLFVIPPRTPELNGCVERCNRTLRYEFYRLYDGLFTLGHLQEALKGYLVEYNTFRPHQALKQLTPMAYYQQLKMEVA